MPIAVLERVRVAVRPTAMRAVAALGLIVVAATSACTDGEDERQVGPLRYAVTYQPDGYDEAEAQPRFDACVSLPGAAFAGSEDKLPPNLFLRFEGSVAQQQELVRCLDGLPGAQVSSRTESGS